MTITRDTRKVCSRIGAAVSAMLGGWVLSAMLVTVVVVILAPQLASNSLFAWILNDATLYVVGLPIFLLIIRTLPDGPLENRPKPAPFGVGRFLLFMVFVVGAMYFLGFITSMLVTLVETLREAPVASALGNANEVPLAATLVLMVVVPGVGEEFIFRYMLRKKLRGAGDGVYIFLSAFCFALFHMNFAQSVYTFAVGAALAWLYVRTDRLWLPMLAHGAVNLVGMLLVPALFEWSSVLYMAVVFGLIAAAFVVFGLSLGRVRAGLYPPTEPGWPGGPPAQNQPPAPYYAAPYAAQPYGPQPYAPPFAAHPYAPPPPAPAYGQPYSYAPPAAPAYPPQPYAGPPCPPQPYGPATGPPAWGTEQGAPLYTNGNLNTNLYNSYSNSPLSAVSPGAVQSPDAGQPSVAAQPLAAGNEAANPGEKQQYVYKRGNQQNVEVGRSPDPAVRQAPQAPPAPRRPEAAQAPQPRAVPPPQAFPPPYEAAPYALPPVYGAPYPAPAPAPYAGYAPQPYNYSYGPAYAAPPAPPKRSLLLANPGMIVLICMCGLMIFANLFL